MFPISLNRYKKQCYYKGHNNLYNSTDFITITLLLQLFESTVVDINVFSVRINSHPKQLDGI